MRKLDFAIQLFGLVLIFSIGVATAMIACANENRYHPGGPYYYKGWKDYKIPYTPYNEVSEEEAKALPSYYEAYFNSDGKITIFKKYLYGNLEWVDQYRYDKNGRLISRELKKANGDVIIHYFDEKGKIIWKE